MRVIVCGSRRWRDRERIANRLFDLPPGSTIVEGEAPGADRIARQEGQKLGHLILPWPAAWTTHDRNGATGLMCNCRPDQEKCPRAGHRRNENMAQAGADLCIAFWDGESPGTKDMVDRATAHGIPVEVIAP